MLKSSGNIISTDKSEILPLRTRARNLKPLSLNKNLRLSVIEEEIFVFFVKEPKVPKLKSSDLSRSRETENTIFRWAFAKPIKNWKFKNWYRVPVYSFDYFGLKILFCFGSV